MTGSTATPVQLAATPSPLARTLYASVTPSDTVSQWRQDDEAVGVAKRPAELAEDRDEDAVVRAAMYRLERDVKALVACRDGAALLIDQVRAAVPGCQDRRVWWWWPSEREGSDQCRSVGHMLDLIVAGARQAQEAATGRIPGSDVDAVDAFRVWFRWAQAQVAGGAAMDAAEGWAWSVRRLVSAARHLLSAVRRMETQIARPVRRRHTRGRRRRPHPFKAQVVSSSSAVRAVGVRSEDELMALAVASRRVAEGWLAVNKERRGRLFSYACG